MQKRDMEIMRHASSISPGAIVVSVDVSKGTI